MSPTKKNKVITLLLLLSMLTAGGYLCYIMGQKSIRNEGIRTATFCNSFAIPENPRLTTDMRGDAASYRGHSTFALFNASEDAHIDVYGKMQLITPYCALLYTHEGERFGALNVLNDLAVVVAESGEVYELKYFDVGTYVSDDETGWHQYYSD